MREELEDIKNATDKTVSVPVEDDVKLIQQAALLLGQGLTQCCIVLV